MQRVVKQMLFLGSLLVAQLGMAQPPCEDFLLSQGTSSSLAIRELRAELNSHVEALTDHIEACDMNRQGFKRDSILAGAVCGISSRWIADLLTASGYEVERYISWDMGIHFYAADHIFAVVRIEGEEILVDPAYYQFLRIYGLRPDSPGAPEEKILVLNYKDLDRWIESLEEKGFKNFELLRETYGPNLGGLRSKAEMGAEKRKALLKHVWDFKADHYNRVGR